MKDYKFLKKYDPELYKLLVFAEGYPANDPQASLIRLRQFGELLARLWANKLNVFIEAEESYSDLLKRLQDRGKIPVNICNEFHQLRVGGNEALHFLQGDSKTARANLNIAKRLSKEFDLTFANHLEKSGMQTTPAPMSVCVESSLIEEDSLELQEVLKTDSPQTDFTGKELIGMDFSGRDLQGFDFTGAYLNNAKFCLANLKNVSFRGADIRGADFRNAKYLQSNQVEDTLRDRKTRFPDRLQRVIDSQDF
jgi:hypothetical protein